MSKKASLPKRLHLTSLCALVAFVAVLLAACSTRIGLKENWIDENDLLDLTQQNNVDLWSDRVGAPVLLEKFGDTLVYYYNFRPTLYATLKVKGDGESVEDNITIKPGPADRTKLWGSRVDLVRIRSLRNQALSIEVVGGYRADASMVLYIDGGYDGFDKLDSVSFEKPVAPEVTPVTLPAPAPSYLTQPQPAAPAPAAPAATQPVGVAPAAVPAPVAPVVKPAPAPAAPAPAAAKPAAAPAPVAAPAAQPAPAPAAPAPAAAKPAVAPAPLAAPAITPAPIAPAKPEAKKK
jgi:hypothetical protein